MKRTLASSIVICLMMMACDHSPENSPEQKSQAKQSSKPGETNLESYGIKSSTIPQGLSLGDHLPDITMKTDDDQMISLADLYHEQPLVVIFYRGYWCPVCNRYLSTFAERAVELENAGAKILAITPESYDNTEKTIQNTGIDFTVISDIDGSVMTAFDVNFQVTDDYHQTIKENLNASISASNASNEAVLPIPATFVIDTNGVVIYRQFDPNYKNRASIEDILKYLP
ncbi:MAG: peroxiredoxin family protein [Salibacteraceae bacterium]